MDEQNRRFHRSFLRTAVIPLVGLSFFLDAGGDSELLFIGALFVGYGLLDLATLRRLPIVELDRDRITVRQTVAMRSQAFGFTGVVRWCRYRNLLLFHLTHEDPIRLWLGQVSRRERDRLVETLGDCLGFPDDLLAVELAKEGGQRCRILLVIVVVACVALWLAWLVYRWLG